MWCFIVVNVLRAKIKDINWRSNLFVADSEHLQHNIYHNNLMFSLITLNKNLTDVRFLLRVFHTLGTIRVL